MGEFKRQLMTTLPTRSKRASDGRTTMLIGGTAAVLFLLVAITFSAVIVPKSGISTPLILFLTFPLGMVALGVQMFIQGRRSYIQQREDHLKSYLAMFGRGARRASGIEKPLWLRDYAWNQGGIEDCSREEAGHGLQLFFMLQCILLIFHAGMIHAVFIRREYYVLIMAPVFLALDLWSLLFLAKALRVWFSRSRHGTSRIEFVNPPYDPGGVLMVHFYPPKSIFGLRREGELAVTLRYTEEKDVKDIKGRTHLWRESVYTDALRLPIREIRSNRRGEAYFELEFEIPKEGIQTRLLYYPARYWELEITGEIPGLNFFGRYLVPVYFRDPKLAEAAESDGEEDEWIEDSEEDQREEDESESSKRGK